MSLSGIRMGRGFSRNSARAAVLDGSPMSVFIPDAPRTKLTFCSLSDMVEELRIRISNGFKDLLQ